MPDKSQEPKASATFEDALLDLESLVPQEDTDLSRLRMGTVRAYHQLEKEEARLQERSLVLAQIGLASTESVRFGIIDRLWKEWDEQRERLRNEEGLKLVEQRDEALANSKILDVAYGQMGPQLLRLERDLDAAREWAEQHAGCLPHDNPIRWVHADERQPSERDPCIPPWRRP